MSDEFSKRNSGQALQGPLEMDYAQSHGISTNTGDPFVNFSVRVDPTCVYRRVWLMLYATGTNPASATGNFYCKFNGRYTYKRRMRLFNANATPPTDVTAAGGIVMPHWVIANVACMGDMLVSKIGVAALAAIIPFSLGVTADEIGFEIDQQTPPTTDKSGWFLAVESSQVFLG